MTWACLQCGPTSCGLCVHSNHNWGMQIVLHRACWTTWARVLRHGHSKRRIVLMAAQHHQRWTCAMLLLLWRRHAQHARRDREHRSFALAQHRAHRIRAILQSWKAMQTAQVCSAGHSVLDCPHTSLMRIVCIKQVDALLESEPLQNYEFADELDAAWSAGTDHIYAHCHSDLHQPDTVHISTARHSCCRKAGVRGKQLTGKPCCVSGMHVVCVRIGIHG
jgi:hypothetical protein